MTPAGGRPAIFVLARGTELQPPRGWPGGATPEHLAAALAANCPWPGPPRAALVLRDAPPLLAAVGTFDEAQVRDLEALREQLERTLPRLRYLEYPQVERACERLAAELRRRLGPRLPEFRASALPRGGLIVLGMLAYALGLEAEQLAPPTDPAAPLLLVDDCALSGARLRAAIAAQPQREVAVALLAATPELCAAVEAEPRVSACVSAVALRDHAPADHGDAYPAWRERWRQRSGARTYWLGRPDPVCFPWNEPDATFWHPERGAEARAWRLLPPERCLKNRHADGAPLPLLRQRPGAGPLRAGAGVIHADLGDRVVAGSGEDGRAFELTDTAADTWRALLAHGSVAAAAAALQAEYRTDEDLAGRVRAFAEQLRAAGLLERPDV